MKIATLDSLKRFFLDLKEYLKSFLMQSETITLSVDNWSKVGDYYEYDIKDNSVTEKHLINANLDLDNQPKMIDGTIKSYDGGYKIITSSKPKEDILMDITIQKTVAKEASK